jgi:hypothetical protein
VRPHSFPVSFVRYPESDVVTGIVFHKSIGRTVKRRNSSRNYCKFRSVWAADALEPGFSRSGAAVLRSGR